MFEGGKDRKVWARRFARVLKVRGGAFPGGEGKRKKGDEAGHIQKRGPDFS